jgi:hypothetical protein
LTENARKRFVLIANIAWVLLLGDASLAVDGLAAGGEPAQGVAQWRPAPGIALHLAP